jgi:16S rRNA (guanine966-N2)-methyltransferase
VDTDVRLALRNVARLGVEDRCEVVRADAITWLRGSRGSFDLIFCDPPYRLADRLEGDLAKLLPRRLSPGGRVIAESAARRPLELGMTPLDERAYGDTLVRFLAGGDAR